MEETISLRQSGGSLTARIPAEIVKALKLHKGARVNLTMQGDTIVLRPAAPVRPRYTLAELIAQCDPTAPMTAEDEAWVGDGQVGNEAI